jgi:hypothetical protein
VIKSFVAYRIDKGNTNVRLKFIWPTMKKKEKIVKPLRIREILFYLCPRSSVLSRGMHWVSW